MEEKLAVLRKMFCCGISPRTFNKHFLNLDSNKQQQLIKVAEKVQFCYVIRYDLSVFSPLGMGEDYEYQIEFKQLSSLEVYLLVTCIDTLSGNPKFKPVDQYIKDELNDDKSYSKFDIVKMLSDYREIYGPRHTIKQEFLNLSDAHKEWIAHNVAFQDMSSLINLSKKHQDKEILLKKLFKYFYDRRRIEYTHESKTRSTTIDRYPKELTEGWSPSLSGWDDLSDKKKRFRTPILWYRTGLDEGIILKVILHGVVLRKMKIIPDISVIERYLLNELRIKTINGLIREIENNSRLGFNS